MASNVLVAERFAQLTEDKLRYDEEAGCFREWTLNHWRRLDQEGPVERAVIRLLEEERRSTTMRMVRDVVELCKLHTACVFQNGNGNYVPFANKYLDLNTGTLCGLHKGLGMTYALPYGYDGSRECPKIARFLAGLLPSRVAVEAMMTHLGLSLRFDRTFHKAILLVGPGGCGKSTMLRLANLLVGQQAEQTFDRCLFTADAEGMRERHEARGERVCCHDEFPRSVLVDDSLFKAMTAHQEVSSRQIYGRASSGPWRPKFLIATNDMPVVADRSGALARRLIVLRCNARTEVERPCFEEELIPELGAFAALCLDYAKGALERRSYPTEEGMEKVYATAALTSDPVKLWVRREVQIAPYCVVPLFKAYRVFRDFVDDLGYATTNLTQFERRMTDYTEWGIRSEVIGGEVYLVGMRLPYPGEEDGAGVPTYLNDLTDLEIAGYLNERGVELVREDGKLVVVCEKEAVRKVVDTFCRTHPARAARVRIAQLLQKGERPVDTLFPEEDASA